MSSPTPDSRPVALRVHAPRSLALVVAALAVLAAGSTSGVTVPSRHPLVPVVGLSEPEPVGAGTAGTSTTQLYKFSAYVGGKPVRWNPCAAIHWRFRTTAAPRGGLTIAKAAVAKVALATGIRFVYDGTTTAVPNSKWLPTSTSNVRPLLIGWTDASHSDLLAGRPRNVLGVTRTAYFAATVDGRSLAATKAAVVALDRTDRLPLTGSVSWSSVLQHELGHAMGLDHVGNTRELMYPVLQRTLSGLQPGDRTGLYRLGRAAGCISLPY